MKYFTATVALATLSLSLVSGAHAETNTPRRSETVNFSDLDITSAGGAKLLFQRLSAAASRVCRDPGESRLPDSPQLRCRDRAVGDAVARVDAPAVTMIAQAHGLHPAKGAGSN